MPTSNNVIQVVINGKNNALPAFKSATKMVVAFGAASAAALTVAAVRAGKFERQMAEIATLLDGDTTPAIQDMRKEIMDLSVEFGQAIGKMTKARYDVISAGFTSAADSAIVLREASKLAVAGVADVAIAADLVTDALGGLELGAGEAARVSDVLFQTVRKGKTTLAQLGQGLGKVFGTAKTAGVSLEELSAAMATSTASGVKTAESITGLNALILAIAAPTKESADALKAAGIDISKGFTQSIIDVGTASGDSLAKLRQLIPSVEALRVAAKIAGNVDLLKENLDAMTNSAGATDKAFAEMSDTFDFKMDQAKASIDNLVITIGTALLPAFSDVIDKVTTTATMILFLAEETETGTRRWKEYWTELEKSSPILKAIGDSVKFVKDQMEGLNEIADKKAFDTRVTEEMKRLQESGEVVMQKWYQGNTPSTLNLRELRQYAESIVKFKDSVNEAPSDDGFLPQTEENASSVGAIIKKIIEDMARLKAESERALVPASEIIKTGFGAPKEGEVLGPEAPSAVSSKLSESQEQMEELKERIAGLAQFTTEHFAEMAFAIGDNFSMVAADIANHMLGLTKGPLMLGRAFRSMAAGVVSDIARIIGRLLVAKALLAAFGGGGFLGSIAGALTSFGSGGTIPQAASGMAMPGGMSMVVPGSPGLDRSLVLAHGGEVMVPRQTVDGIDRSRRRAQQAPPPARRNKARSGAGQRNYQLLRPLRREEQNLLTDSINEAETRSERHRG